MVGENYVQRSCKDLITQRPDIFAQYVHDWKLMVTELDLSFIEGSLFHQMFVTADTNTAVNTYTQFKDHELHVVVVLYGIEI